jgi:hypothetical protein
LIYSTTNNWNYSRSYTNQFAQKNGVLAGIFELFYVKKGLKITFLFQKETFFAMNNPFFIWGKTERVV